MTLPQSNEINIAVLLTKVGDISETVLDLRETLATVTDKIQNQEIVRIEQLTKLEHIVSTLSSNVDTLMKMELPKNVSDMQKDIKLLNKIVMALGGSLLTLIGSLVYYVIVNYILN